MNIESLKNQEDNRLELLNELENLKKAEQNIYSQLNNKIDKKIILWINSIITDFEEYFKEQNFEFQKNTSQYDVYGFSNSMKNTIFTASYKGIKIELTYNDGDINALGIYFSFKLNLYLPLKSHYLVILRPENDRISITLTKGSFKESELNDLLREKDSFRDRIEKLEHKVEHISNETWELWIYEQDTHSKNFSHGNPFSSMRKLLEFMFESQSQK